MCNRLNAGLPELLLALCCVQMAKVGLGPWQQAGRGLSILALHSKQSTQARADLPNFPLLCVVCRWPRWV